MPDSTAVKGWRLNASKASIARDLWRKIGLDRIVQSPMSLPVKLLQFCNVY
jgi:hypothetical protein